MRRSLLNKLNTPKALRQALVLFTLLLLPSAAWGDVTYTSTFQIDGSGSSTQCSAKESTGNFRYNWTSNIDVAQGDYLTIVADQSYSLVSAYRILGTVKSVVVRGSGLASLKIYYSQNIDGSSSTLMGEPSFNDNTYTFTPESQIGDLNSSYLCLSFKGDTSGGKIESIEVTFTPKLRVGNYVFEATETSFDDGKIIFQKDNSDNYYLLLKEASIEGNIEWHVGHDLNLKFSGTNRITNIASDASSNYAIKGSGSNALNIIQNTDASTTTPDALILASYTSNTHENATDLITGSTNTGASTLVNFENYDDNNIKYQCYTTSDNVFGLTVGDRKVHNIPNLVGHKEDVLGDGKVSFDGTNTLTLNNAALSKNILWSNQDANFTVNLIGSNSISIPQGSPCISSGYSRTLSFTRGDTSNPCSLTLLSEANIDVFYGFSNASSPTVTGLYWIPNKVENTGKISSATITSSLLGGGDGSENSPFIISTYEHLKDFSTYVNDGTITTECVKLADDLENGILDCSGKTDFEPIGNGSKQFEGTFDGNNKTISNLSMTNVNSKNVGLFGYNDGTIKNLTLSSCTISGGSSSSPSYIGALAGENSGSISGCTVINCTVSCNEDSSNPYVGGIVGILHGSITNCVVENTSVNAVTSDVSASDPTAYAGGIAGSRNNNTISGCTVKGTTTVTADYSKCSTDVFAGAIVGILQGQGTFTDNTYESTVTTKAKKQGDSDYTTKSGQTQRGIGNGNDEIGKVELAGTKKVTVEIISFAGSNWSCNAVEGTYYTYTSTSTNYILYYVLPGCDFTYSMKPENGRKPAFALSDNTIKVTAVEKTVNGAYDHTEFTFTMPNADLEVTRSFPIDLAAISADNFSIDDANYTGEAIVPTTVKVIGAPGSVGSTPRQLTKDTDFTIKGYKLNGESVDSPVDIGTYTVTIEGTGNYIGTQDVSYEIVKAYALKINGTQLNAKNIDDFYGNGTVKFTPATETEPTNTLTLNGASITGSIVSGLGDLTIDIQGTNTITRSDTASVIRSTNGGQLMITKTGTAASLQLSNNYSDSYPLFHHPVIKDFDSFKLSEGVYLSDTRSDTNGEGDPAVYGAYDNPTGGNSTMGLVDPTYMFSYQGRGISQVKLSTDVSYPLWIADYKSHVGNGYNIVYTQVTPTNKDNVLSGDNAGKVSFTPASSDNNNVNTLSLNSAVITEAILTSLPNLTIAFSGENTLDASGGTAGYIYGSDPNAVLTFKALTTDGSISLSTANERSVVEGFADVAFIDAVAQYDGAFSYNKTERKYKNQYGALSLLTIAPPIAPKMTIDYNDKVKLTKSYNEGDIYYTIAYADGKTEYVPKTKYSGVFAMEAPGTVEAWVEVDNAETNKTKGKHFGYKDAPYTMAVGGTKAITTIIPAIEEGDGISIVESSYIEDSEIATLSEGVITAIGIGNTVLSTPLDYVSGTTSTTVILNYSDRVTAAINVGENLSNYFEGSNEFGTFYNEDSEIYAVPQGMKAYVVTGVSGSKLVTVETTVLPPNTVVLLDKAEGISFTKVPSEGAAPGGNLLKHATAEVSVTTESSLYVLYNDTYVKATAGSPIPSGKNYLDLSPTTNAGTRGFYNIGGANDGTSALREVKSEGVKSEKRTDDKCFDLQGRRLSAKPTKSGLYLHNGIKVVIK